MKPFLVHLAVYLLVNAGLAVLNLSQPAEEGQARDLWFVWPLAGWGIGVAAHGLAVLLKTGTREDSLLADRDIQGIVVHAFVYVAVNLLLITVNIVTAPQSLWFVWPLLGWGAGLAAHAFFAYRNVTRRTLESYATGQRILAEMETERLEAELSALISGTEALAEEKPPAKGKRKPARGKKAAAKKPAVKKPARAPAKKAAGKKAGGSSRSKSKPAGKAPARRRGSSGRKASA